MLAFDERPDLADTIRHAGPIGWAARNASKPGRGDAECWVVQGSPEFSREYLEEEKAGVETLLLDHLRNQAGGNLPRCAHVSVHRWRYAMCGDAGKGAIWSAETGIRCLRGLAAWSARGECLPVRLGACATGDRSWLMLRSGTTAPVHYAAGKLPDCASWTGARRSILSMSAKGNAESCPLAHEDLLARFHAREDGRLLSGAAAFAAMWRAIPLLRPLGEAGPRSARPLGAGKALSPLPRHPSLPAASCWCAGNRHDASAARSGETRPGKRMGLSAPCHCAERPMRIS